jgi:hypothetical protein
MQRLHEAGARAPRVQSAADFTARMSALARSVAKGVPMISPHDVSLWFYTDLVDVLYEVLKSRRVEAAQCNRGRRDSLAARTGAPPVRGKGASPTRLVRTVHLEPSSGLT